MRIKAASSVLVPLVLLLILPLPVRAQLRDFGATDRSWSDITTDMTMTLCHIPPGNPENAQTIEVAAAAVPAHLAHGDAMGACPSVNPRFTDNQDGTFTDNLTGLVWLKSFCWAPLQWNSARNAVNNLADGECNLTDGSVAGDWRLPEVKELLSLIDYGRIGPAIPDDFPVGALQAPYWSNTEYVGLPNHKWMVNFNDGAVLTGQTNSNRHVRPVRCGQ